MITNNCSPKHRMHRHPFFSTWPMYFEDIVRGKDYADNVPSVNIAESDNAWLIEVSAPGFAKEDFKVNLEKNVLTVSAEHKNESKVEEMNYMRREFSRASFSRSFRIRESEVSAEKIAAVYENGILNITIPKTNAEENKGITINIQ